MGRRLFINTLVYLLKRKEINMNLADYLANTKRINFDRLAENPEKYIRHWRFFMKEPQIFFNAIFTFAKMEESERELARERLIKYEEILNNYYYQMHLSSGEDSLVRNKIRFAKSLLEIV